MANPTQIKLTKDQLEVYADLCKWVLDNTICSCIDVERYGDGPCSSKGWMYHDEAFSGRLRYDPAYLIGSSNSGKSLLTNLLMQHMEAIGCQVKIYEHHTQKSQAIEYEYKFYFPTPNLNAAVCNLRHANTADDLKGKECANTFILPDRK